MILTADVRKRKLEELNSKDSKNQAKQKLFYRGRTQMFSVHEIDLDWLIYNRHNGRLEAEMLTWEKENSASPETYDDALNERIENFLWDSSPARNAQTLEDLEEKSQQRPGIVSLDGVIIDGNRRAMLLKKLEGKKQTKKYFEAIILPDAYDENPKEIVRLETQYQMGEDEKVEYGPLQKYLHARRLLDLGIKKPEIENIMKLRKGGAATLLGILELMDDYLAYIQCEGLYTMLRDKDGTKEGMFVDLYSDLNKLAGGKAKVPWTFNPDVELLKLKIIQFDFMRMGEFVDAKKSYRQISHGKSNFFGNKDIWERFRDQHFKETVPLTKADPDLKQFIADRPGFESRVDAARARDEAWKTKVKPSMQGNFRRSWNTLSLRTDEAKPKEYLERAKELLEKIDIDGQALLLDPENANLAKDINRISYEMKKRFDRAVN